MNERKIAYDELIQKLNSEHLSQMQSNEKILQTALEECNHKCKQAELEIEKTRIIREDVNNEKMNLTIRQTLVMKEQQMVEQERQLVEQQRKMVEQQKIVIENERELMEKTMMELKEKANKKYSSNTINEELHEAVEKNLAHVQLIYELNFSKKRVVIYSHYSESEEVESYNWLTIESIEHYFDYVIILTNCPNKWKLNPINHNKFYLLNYNMKSDFRNYGTFILQTKHKLVNAECVALVNDSFVVVDVNSFGCCIKNLFENKLASYNFIGLTSSHEHQFHMQSYFLCFKSTILQYVIDYFETTGLPNNHNAAISLYELGLSTHLMKQGVSQFAFVSNNEMKNPFNTTCCKWKEVLNETGIIKRQHFFKKYPIMAMTDNDISEVAETHSYNVHFINFLKYHNVRLITTKNTSVQ